MAVVFVQNPLMWRYAFQLWQGEPLGGWMTKRLELAHLYAVLESPHPMGIPRNRTGINYSKGVLATSITTSKGHTAGGDMEGHVIALPKYALWVHEGTQPHTIRPVRARRLKFFWARKGRTVSLRVVHHPGSMANPFLLRALERATPT